MLVRNLQDKNRKVRGLLRGRELDPSRIYSRTNPFAQKKNYNRLADLYLRMRNGLNRRVNVARKYWVLKVRACVYVYTILLAAVVKVIRVFRPLALSRTLPQDRARVYITVIRIRVCLRTSGIGRKNVEAEEVSGGVNARIYMVHVPPQPPGFYFFSNYRPTHFFRRYFYCFLTFFFFPPFTQTLLSSRLLPLVFPHT